MNWPVWCRRLRARIRYRHFDTELREEIEAHRASLTADLERRGAGRDEAEAAAARAMGNVMLQREEARGIWIAPWLESLGQDLRYGVRSLRRSPAFTITALLTMAIGIGLNTAMFTTVNAVGLRGWPVEHADTLVVLNPDGFGFTLDDLRDFQRRSRTLGVVAASRMAFLSVAAEPDARGSGGYGRYVTPGYFDAIGVPMVLGRNFRADEDRDGAPERVVIISHQLWRRLFNGAPDVVGRSLYFGSTPYVIIGVTREGWRGEQPYRDDIWLPMQALRSFRPEDRSFSAEAGYCCVQLLGRLAPGVTRARAAEELTLLVRQRAPRTEDRPRRVSVSGTSMFDRTEGPIRLAIPVLILAATAIVLLLTGANIAHLQLARAMARGREIRTRLALGAGRGRVARQLATEALLLSIVAGVLGMAMVYAIRDTLMRISEMELPEIWAPDARVFAYCVLVSLMMSLVFSLLPALRSTRVSLVHGAGPAATPGGRLRFNLVLLTTQIALSTALLTGASLLSRALTQATSGEVGFSLEGVTVASYSRTGSAPDSAMTAPLFRQALARALSESALPHAALVDRLPFSFFQTADVRRPGDGPRDAKRVEVVPMSASGFAVLGIAMAEGRPHTDRPGSDEAVLNESAARLFWPGESAIGRTLLTATRSYTVVGVTRDVHFTSRDSIRPLLHLPAGTDAAYPAIVLRGDGPAIAAQLRAIVTGLDPQATVVVRSLSEHLASRLVDEQAGADAAWAGGLLALALATFGVFGVFAYVVEERRREIGIRVALGAQQSQVLRALFRTARLAIVSGLAVGLVLSLAIGPMLQQFLFGLSPFDPLAFATVAMILTAAGLAATFIPARRALTVEPAVILKDDA